MTTTEKARKRAPRAIPGKTATNHRKNKKRTSDVPKPVEGPYRQVDIPLEDIFAGLGRDGVEVLVDHLITMLDQIDADQIDRETNGDELDASYPEAGPHHLYQSNQNEDAEEGGDNEPALGSFDRIVDQGVAWHPFGMGAYFPNPIDGEVDRSDDEPALASVAADEWSTQERWAAGNADDREGDPCCDDREGDEQQHGGDEHDGAEPDVDGEPSLGWTVDGVLQNSDGMDRELDGSYVTQERHCGYRRQARFNAPKDGLHVDTNPSTFGLRQIINLTDRQRRLLSPRIDRGEVRL